MSDVAEELPPAGTCILRVDGSDRSRNVSSRYSRNRNAARQCRDEICAVRVFHFPTSIFYQTITRRMGDARRVDGSSKKHESSCAPNSTATARPRTVTGPCKSFTTPYIAMATLSLFATQCLKAGVELYARKAGPVVCPRDGIFLVALRTLDPAHEINR